MGDSYYNVVFNWIPDKFSYSIFAVKNRLWLLLTGCQQGKRGGSFVMDMAKPASQAVGFLRVDLCSCLVLNLQQYLHSLPKSSGAACAPFIAYILSWRRKQSEKRGLLFVLLHVRQFSCLGEHREGSGSCSGISCIPVLGHVGLFVFPVGQDSRAAPRNLSSSWD